MKKSFSERKALTDPSATPIYYMKNRKEAVNMELRTTREMRRNIQIDKLAGKKTETAETSAKAQALQQKGPVDKLTLSRQAVAFVEEQNRKMWAEVREREQQRQKRMDIAAQPDSAELDLLRKGQRILELCQKIAASIMKGNKVPPEDLKFLMENDPDGYRMAMAMRKHNPDPEEEESVLTDEDKNGKSTEGTGGGEAPSVEAAAPAGGGGETSPATA